MVWIWDVDTHEPVEVLTGHTGSVITMAFNQDGSLLASAGEDQTIRIWETQKYTCSMVLHEHTNWVSGIAFKSDASNLLVSGSYDGTIRLWDVEIGECIRILCPPRPYEGMNITGAVGFTNAQRETFKQLGAIDEQDA
jgi:WD40 repeat protein